MPLAQPLLQISVRRQRLRSLPSHPEQYGDSSLLSRDRDKPRSPLCAQVRFSIRMAQNHMPQMVLCNELAPRPRSQHQRSTCSKHRLGNASSLSTKFAQNDADKEGAISTIFKKDYFSKKAIRMFRYQTGKIDLTYPRSPQINVSYQRLFKRMGT